MPFCTESKQEDQVTPASEAIIVGEQHILSLLALRQEMVRQKGYLGMGL
jgi:hypothetical protein